MNNLSPILSQREEIFANRIKRMERANRMSDVWMWLRLKYLHCEQLDSTNCMAYLLRAELDCTEREMGRYHCN